MMLHYDPALLTDRNEKLEYFVYSPATHHWAKVDEPMHRLITLIIENGGHVDPHSVAGQMVRNGYELDADDVSRHVARLLQTGLFFLSEQGFQAARTNAMKQYAIENIQKLEIAYLHPTLRCNFRCWYCYNQNVSAQAEISTSQWIDIIRQLRHRGIKVLIFTGGEVLLRDDLEEILKKAPLDGIHVEILTNGSLLKGRLEALLPLVSKIVISLDSLDPHINALNRSPNAFNEIIKAIEQASRIGPQKVTVRSVVTRYNRDQIRELKNILHEKYGIRTLESVFIPNTPEEVHLVPDMNDFLDAEVGEVPVGTEIGGFRCGAASNIIAVGSDGCVYPCQSLLLEQFRITNMLNATWYQELLESPVRKRFRGLSVDRMDTCMDCSFRYFCGGGCPAISYKVYGDLSCHPKYFCQYLKSAARNRLVHGKVEWDDAI